MPLDPPPLAHQATVDTRYEGRTLNYTITGSHEAVTAAIERIRQSYPPAGYGTWFHWPRDSLKTLDGKPLTYKAPYEVEPGVWRAFGHRGDSSD